MIRSSPEITEQHAQGATLLRDYVIEQGCTDPIHACWGGYETGAQNYRRIGACYFQYEPVTQERQAKVVLSDFCNDCSRVTYNAAMWHEAAHATQWINDASTGHGPGWMKYYFKRPVLATVGSVFAVFEYVLRNIRK